MPNQKNTQRKNINFRQTKSDRSATKSYQNFNAFRKKMVTKVMRGK